MAVEHRNWDTGLPCHCPYGLHAEFDPTLAKTAGNVQKLKSPKNRPDLQTPEGQQWLQYLEGLPPKTDAIAPWMTREWKQGRLIHHQQYPRFPYKVWAPEVVHGQVPNSEYRRFTAPQPIIRHIDELPYESGKPVSPIDADVDSWADWHHSNHPNKQGVNIESKDFQVPQMQQKVQEYKDDLAAKEREGYGEVVHQFPDNWSIRRLQNAEECKDEGKNMGHCAAQYGRRVEGGENLMYSLRDPKNNPHATFDVTPNIRRFQHTQTGEIESQPWIKPLRDTDNLMRDEWPYQEVTPPINQGTFNQAFGKEDREPLPEYKDRIKQFMESMPEEEKPRARSEAGTINTLFGLLNPQLADHPDMRDYGLYNQKPVPHYTNILSSHLQDLGNPDNVPWDQANQQLVDIAHQRGELPQLQEAMQGIQQRFQEQQEWLQRQQPDLVSAPDSDIVGRVNDLANVIHNPQITQPQITFSKQAAGLYLPQDWNQMFTNHLAPIAQAYEQAPTYDPQAVSAWHDLAQDSAERADQIRNQLNVQETDDPEPYASAQDMMNDIDQGNFTVSRAHSEHPIWTPEQNVNFRIVHDVLGHHKSGADFSWLGENQACGAHFPLLGDNAQKALFSECIGQTAFANHNHGFGPQKTSFIHQPFMQQGYSATMPEEGFCHRHIRHGVYNLRQSKVAAEDELPPAPGTAPVPEGNVRLFHYTHPDNIDAIRQEGIHIPPPMPGGRFDELNQVWAAAGVPEQDAWNQQTRHGRAYVEYHMPPSQLWVGHNEDPATLEQRGSHVTMGDVPPENIVAIHEPWHQAVRELQDAQKFDPNLDMLQNLSDPNTANMAHPEQNEWYSRAYNYVKGRQSSFIQSLSSILEASSPPPKEQRLGSTNLEWEQTDEGATLHISGGTHADRQLARLLLLSDLEAAGIKLASIPMDRDPEEPLGEEFARVSGLPKEAKWTDIMQKAKRIIDSGGVQLLRNGYNNIVAQVTGDHGNYQNEISRDDPNSRAITGWQCQCAILGTKIVMADGSVKNVEDIQTGDTVLTATGRAGVVGQTFSRHYEGQIIGLKPQGFTERVWVTEDHKLPDADYNFKEARHWREDDFSYLPQPVYEPVEAIDVIEFLPNLVEQNGLLYRPNKTYSSKRLRKDARTATISAVQKAIPATIWFDEDFARLLGLFVAEGMTTPRGELRWSFHLKEEHLVDEVANLLEVFGFEGAYKRFVNHAWMVSITSKPLASLFSQLVGTGARNKRLHQYVMAMPTESLQAFFDAWFEGDGHEGQNQRDSLATSSDDLAMQARLILARLQRESCLRVTENNASELVPGGTWLNTLAWRRQGGQGQNVRFFYEDQVYQAMTAPETKEYSGLVYNFEVLDDHTYVMAPGIASANCPWDDFAFQRTRQWKKYEARPCAHTLAAYWAALGAPLDDDAMGVKNVTPGTLPGGPGMGQGGETQPSLPGMTEREGIQPGVGPGEQPSLFDQALQRTPSLQQALQTLEMMGQPEDAGVIPPNPNLEMPDQTQLAQPGQNPPGQLPPPNMVSVPGARPQTAQNPIQMPSTLSSWSFDPETWKMSADSQFENGDMVRLEEPTMGVAQGKSEPHGAGSWREVPENSIGEVLGQDPTTGWVEAHFPIHNAGPMEPFSVRMFLEPGQVSAASNQPPGPFIKRR